LKATVVVWNKRKKWEYFSLIFYTSTRGEKDYVEREMRRRIRGEREKGGD